MSDQPVDKLEEIEELLNDLVRDSGGGRVFLDRMDFADARWLVDEVKRLREERDELRSKLENLWESMTTRLWINGNEYRRAKEEVSDD